LKKFEDRSAKGEDIDNILFECGRVTNQTRCYLPAEEAILVSSFVHKFRKEFELHAAYPCGYSRAPVLPLIDSFDDESGEFTFAKMKDDTAVPVA
jgi:hypothetical protein